jgi:hypothetical protein
VAPSAVVGELMSMGQGPVGERRQSEALRARIEKDVKKWTGLAGRVKLDA